MRPDRVRGTDMTELLVAFRSFANASTNDQNPKSALKKWKRDEKLSSTFPVFLTSPCIFNFRIMKALFEMN